MALLDWARMVLAIGVTIYAALVARQFRGGKLSESYLILVICGLVGACAAASDALNYEMAHGLLGIIFYALLFVALWDIHRVWKNLGKVTLTKKRKPAD